MFKLFPNAGVVSDFCEDGREGRGKRCAVRASAQAGQPELERGSGLRTRLWLLAKQEDRCPWKGLAVWDLIKILSAYLV